MGAPAPKPWRQLKPKSIIYEEVAAGLNNDFRTMLCAVANNLGVSVVPRCLLSIYRLASSIEHSRVIKGKNLKVVLMDYGAICITSRIS